MQRPVRIHPDPLIFWLAAVMVVLVALSITVRVLVGDVQEHRILKRLVLGSEASPSAFFGTLLLASCSLLLALIAMRHKQNGMRWWRHWCVLAAIFAVLAYDEAAMLHERLTSPLRTYFDAGGIFYYTWVIPGLLFVLVVGCMYWPMLRALPRYCRRTFLLGGSVYVGGALGMEMVEAQYVDTYGPGRGAGMITTVEETAEMVGLLIFLHGLVRYLTPQGEPFHVSIQPN